MAKLVIGFVELSSSQPNASLAVSGDWANPLEEVLVSFACELGARKLSKVRGQKLTWLNRVCS